MFQYEFFSLKDFLTYRSRQYTPKTKMPPCFTRGEDIQWIRSSYWAEHCLECGEPLCYETCPNYQPRGDNRCRLLRYGMYDDPHFLDSFYHVAMRFKKWGKIESIVYPGAFSPEKARQVHDDWKQRSLKKAVLMHLGRYGLKRFSIQERRRFDSDKYKFSDKENASNKQETPDFLLQLYSYEETPFTLFFDVTDDADLAFREGITIYPGYNQRCLNMRSLFPPKGKLRAKFYPADNQEVSLVFLFCEFVQLKPGVMPETFPSLPFAGEPAPKVKCVAWDLDNTVWDGILIESDPEALSLRPGVREAMEQLDQRGILQIVLSKNDREQVLPVLQRLGIDQYFIHVLANWYAKSANLQQAAMQMNLGIDAFALIDDSPFERSEVTHTLPMVRAYGETDPEGLLSLQEFCVPITAESSRRRQLYQTEARRVEAAGASQGTDLDFLRSCRLEATLSVPSGEEELLRSLELLQRTNQLNLSGTKYEPEAFFRHVREDDRQCYILTCGDRFGSYGQVAYLEVIPQGDTLVIPEFAMSCRVAGKYVEAALMAALLRRYERDGMTSIRLEGKVTARNGILIQTFLDAGFQSESENLSILLTLRKEELVNPDIVRISILIT